jgi:hypothetical protein
MRKIVLLTVLCVTTLLASAQFTYKIKADTVKITNDACSTELILENSTKNVNGFLFNRDNGRTDFRPAVIKMNNTHYNLGIDTPDVSNMKELNVIDLSSSATLLTVKNGISTAYIPTVLITTESNSTASKAAIHGLAPNMPDNSRIHGIVFGKELSTNNTGFLTYGHVGNGNVGNYVELGIFGTMQFRVFPDKIQVNNGHLELPDVASTPTTPAANYGAVYVDADSLWFKNDGGTQTNLMRVASGVNRVLLASDVVNNNATANTIQDVTGLSFPVTSGVTYKFRFFIIFSSDATTTGSRWTINGPSTTFLHYKSEYTVSTAAYTIVNGASAYNLPAGCNTGTASTGSNIAIIEGVIKPSASGNVIARFASEISNSAITAKGGMSHVEFQAIN